MVVYLLQRGSPIEEKANNHISTTSDTFHVEEISIHFQYQEFISNVESYLSKETIYPIEESVSVCIHPYGKLCGGSKGLFIKSYKVNWDSKLSGSLNKMICKDIIQIHYEKTRICAVNHIRSIEPFINVIIRSYNING